MPAKLDCQFESRRIKEGRPADSALLSADQRISHFLVEGSSPSTRSRFDPYDNNFEGPSPEQLGNPAHLAKRMNVTDLPY